MKLIDNLVNKYGYSNILHVVIAALILSYFCFCGLYSMIIGNVVTFGLLVVKEKLDTWVNKEDIKYGVYGMILTDVIFAMIELIKLIF